MPVKVLIPAPLRSLTAGAAEVEVDAANVQGVIESPIKGADGNLEFLALYTCS